VDVQRDVALPHCHDTVLRYAVTLQVCTHPNVIGHGRIEVKRIFQFDIQRTVHRDIFLQ
jgi:hypothetical protein